MDKITLRERIEFQLARLATLFSPRWLVRLSGKPAVVLDGNTLDPGIQLALSALERRGDPTTSELGPVAARALRRRQAGAIAGRPPAVATVRNLTVDGGAGPLPARLYANGDADTLLVFFHGGGFVIGNLDSHDGVCRSLAVHGGVDVLSVEYRKAPEDPFPAAVDDALAAYRWAAAHAAELGYGRLAVGGDSAGGNLATVVCQALVAAGEELPVLQLLFYPVVDMSEDRASRALFAEGFFLTSDEMDWFSAQYSAAADVLDPRLSPLLGTLEGLPQAIVVTAGFDPLRDEGELYAERLRAAGVPVLARRFGSLIHGFANMGTVSQASHEALIEVCGGVRALVGTR